MAYTYATLSQAISALAARLYDSGNQFWTVAELTSYITESLRTWNSLTSFWRAEMVFDLAEDVWWYDLTQQVGTLRPYTVTDGDLIAEIEHHLLEPSTAAYPLTWTGSAQFSLDDILEAIQRRRDEALSTTGCTLTRSTVPATFVTRTALPDSTIDIRRIAWLPVPDQGYGAMSIQQSDDWAQEAFDYGYTTAPQRQPSTYRQSTQPPLSFDVDAIPPVAGEYEVLTVNAGPALSTAAATLLGVPDDWSWVIKWGALIDLLNRESNAKDEMRAAYCEQRYREGLGLMNQASALLAMRLNNIPIGVGSVSSSDDFDPTWQAQLPGTPDTCHTAGINLIAFGPQPDDGDYSATASVVQNAPVPVAQTDYIQCGKDDYDVILDYAQHLAAFKLGGAEFAATVPLYQRFIKRGALYNSKLAALGQFQPQLYATSQFEEERNPRYSKVKPEGQNG